MAEVSVWSVGHSTHPIDRFIDLVAASRIDVVCDVRGRPYSRYNPQFNREALKAALAASGIAYRWEGDVLSARLLASVATSDRPDYDAIRREPRFLERIGQLIGLASVGRAAMMCAEEDPRRCHRRMLITPALLERGMEVLHLRGDGRIEPESAIAGEHPPSPQLALFR